MFQCAVEQGKGRAGEETGEMGTEAHGRRKRRDGERGVEQHGAQGQREDSGRRTADRQSIMPPVGPRPMPDVRGRSPLTLAQNALDHLCLFFLLFLLLEAPDAPFLELPRFGVRGLPDLMRFLFGLPC